MKVNKKQVNIAMVDSEGEVCASTHLVLNNQTLHQATRDLAMDLHVYQFLDRQIE